MPALQRKGPSDQLGLTGGRPRAAGAPKNTEFSLTDNRKNIKMLECYKDKARFSFFCIPSLFI